MSERRFIEGSLHMPADSPILRLFDAVKAALDGSLDEAGPSEVLYIRRQALNELRAAYSALDLEGEDGK
jgi:hypothetical protein